MQEKWAAADIRLTKNRFQAVFLSEIPIEKYPEYDNLKTLAQEQNVQTNDVLA